MRTLSFIFDVIGCPDVVGVHFNSDNVKAFLVLFAVLKNRNKI